MSLPPELAAHLRLFADLGVNGLSRDPAWRDRRGPAADQVAAAEGPSALGSGLPAEAPEPTAEPPALRAQRPTSSAPRPQPVVSRPEPSAQRPEPSSTSLESIRSDIGDCTRCPLHALGRRQIVFGVGNPNADLMFVGEAPGADEDVQGEPFVGRAGQLLTKIIEAIGLSRADVYIANVIKCRPPGNRNPEPVEVATCRPFLLQQIDAIRPKVIVALGTFAAQALLETDTPISRLRGRVQPFHGGVKLVPTFHPAFLLRSPDRKRDVWEDMKLVRGLLTESD